MGLQRGKVGARQGYHTAG
uniref:Uncharacterized protein n=1 Tax=Rhizophora mucronata TaxID=61149 RepID=A0A2P2NM49_RHIMU